LWFLGLSEKMNMKDNVIKDRSFELAREIVFVYQYLTREKREYVLSKQVLRSGTSVGANISEGVAAPSRKDFSYRMSVAYKEARETEFWLKLLCTTGYLTQEKAEPAIKKCDEVPTLFALPALFTLPAFYFQGNRLIIFLEGLYRLQNLYFVMEV
jgi:four helix bundle protein